MNKYINKCLQCGICCQTIPMLHDFEFFKNYLASGCSNEKNNYDVKFILENFEEISFDDAINININLKNNPRASLYKKYYTYYKCKKLVNNKCSCYDKRPHLCRKYPFHTNINNIFMLDDIESYQLQSLINGNDCGYGINLKSTEIIFNV